MGIESLFLAGLSYMASDHQSDKMARAEREARERAERQQKEMEAKSRQEQRKQNQNRPDTDAILQQNTNDKLSGGSTLLTGAGGVKQDDLTLGKGNKLG